MRQAGYRDRTEAGQELARALGEKARGETVIYALPRGGVPVAFEVARALDAPLDVLLVRKIGLPGQPELAVAAVANGTDPHIVVNEDVAEMAGVSRSELVELADRELREIERRHSLYRRPAERPDPKGKTAIVVDDGLATGATARAALEAMRASGASKVILAVPVGSAHALRKMSDCADEVICLLQPANFSSVGQWYDDFHQLSDAEVIALLEQRATDASARPGG